MTLRIYNSVNIDLAFIKDQLYEITKHILSDHNVNSAINLKLVDDAEMIELNLRFRGKNKTTNVLAFSSDSEEMKASDELGDIAINYSYLTKEAGASMKTIEAHFLHLLSHGILHLLGYDHTKESDAINMEKKEIRYLELFGIKNPYT